MMKLQIFRLFVIISVGCHFFTGSTVFTINNGFMTLQMDPLSLLFYPFFVFATWFSLNVTPNFTNQIARWWRGFTAFITDFVIVLNLIGLPLCFAGLVIENGGFPKEWSISRQLDPNENVLFSVILFPSILVMIGAISLALHPNIVSPGALFAGVDIRTEKEKPAPKLAMWGFLSYFLVALPFMKHFIFSEKEKSNLEPRVVLRNA
ncbi:hypothetical protein [Alteromonas stellipolaris]|uniref:hypothetical protein n=1 Tax=Alteromonas stellipolaris TaxID=233316 RepID=UPI001DE3F31E|nr:hypothetical protein [Alteromonas stellipolaris]MBZ2163346.1 hypothetical protein [Alteromonas stellipolaris]